MNKRQRKKLDKKLYKAIKELNEDIAKDSDGEVEITEQGLSDTLVYVKKHNTVKQVFKAHRRLVYFE